MRGNVKGQSIRASEVAEVKMTTQADKRKLDISPTTRSETRGTAKRKKEENTVDKHAQTYYLKRNFLNRAASVKKFIERRYWGVYSGSYRSTPRKCLYCSRFCTFGEYQEHENECLVRIVSESLSNSKRILDFCLIAQDIYDEEIHFHVSEAELIEFIRDLTIEEVNDVYCNWLWKQTDRKFTEIYDTSYFFEDLKAKTKPLRRCIKKVEIVPFSESSESESSDSSKPLSRCSKKVELEPFSESGDSESSDSESSESESSDRSKPLLSRCSKKVELEPFSESSESESSDSESGESETDSESGEREAKVEKEKECKRWIHPCRKNDTEVGCGSVTCNTCKYINNRSAVKDWLEVHPLDAWIQNVLTDPGCKYKPWIYPCRKSIKQLGCGYDWCERCRYKHLSHAMRDWFEVHPEELWDRETFKRYHGIEITNSTIYSHISGICRNIRDLDFPYKFKLMLFD